MSLEILKSREESLLRDFQDQKNWEERYEKIIALGKKLPDLPEQYRSENYKVKGCQSQVWMFAEMQNEKIHFFADSDALIVRGLIGVLLFLLQDLPPAVVMNADLSVFEKIGLQANLSPSRANGFQAMVKQMKMYALAFQYQSERA